jgi:hypothetical protein
MDVIYLVNLVAAMLILDAALTVTLAPVIAVVLVFIAVRLVFVAVGLVFVAVRLVFVTAIRLAHVVRLHSVRARQRLGSVAESVTKRVQRGGCRGDDEAENNVGEEGRETRKHDRKQESSNEEDRWRWRSAGNC